MRLVDGHGTTIGKFTDNLEGFGDLLCETIERAGVTCNNCIFNDLCEIGHKGTTEWLRENVTEEDEDEQPGMCLL